MTVSVLLPTMGRPGMAVQCVTRLVETTRGHDLEIIAAVDGDPETLRRLHDLRDAHDLPLEVLYQTERQGCSAAWNRCLAACQGDPVVFAADDLEWGDGWLTEALKVMDTFGPDGGLVGFNDGHWNGWDLATHYMMSRQFIIQVLGGVVAWDFYRHSFNDLEVNQRAKQAGRFAWAEHAHVHHRHWLFGDREQDATDRATLGEHSESEAVYQRRAAAGFPSDYPPVIVS